jgi:hypothetical protein
MECTIMDKWIDCETRYDTDSKSTAFMGYHYRIGYRITTGPRLFGSFHMVDLYCTINLPGYAKTGYGWGWDGDEFQ